MKKWSSQWAQFMQLRKEAWKKTSTGFEPVTLQLPVWCSTNWAMKPLTLGAGQLWVHMFPGMKEMSVRKKRTSKNCSGQIINLCNLLHLLDILRLFQGGKGGTNSVKTEKLRALLHYFRRITRESKWLDNCCWLFQKRFGHQLCLQNCEPRGIPALYNCSVERETNSFLLLY